MSEYRTLSVDIDTKGRFKQLLEEMNADTQSEGLEKLIESYEFQRLRQDMRIREARQVVANDHDMAPENLSLQALLKVTCGAYCGYNVATDWKVEGENHA
jgi:hypothetical protein